MLYLELLNEMKEIPYEQCNDMLEALAFLQEMAATALWKYHQGVGQKMKAFVKEFDRLDVLSERVRLYESAQAH